MRETQKKNFFIFKTKTKIIQKIHNNITLILVALEMHDISLLLECTHHYNTIFLMYATKFTVTIDFHTVRNWKQSDKHKFPIGFILSTKATVIQIVFQFSLWLYWFYCIIYLLLDTVDDSKREPSALSIYAQEHFKMIEMRSSCL